MSDIDWNQTRALYRDEESSDVYVKVELGYMEVSDYVEGGCVMAPFEVKGMTLKSLGRFTNAQIQNGDYDD